MPGTPDALKTAGRRPGVLVGRSEDASAWDRMGDAYARDGKVTEAVAAWTRAADLDPTCVNARYSLGAHHHGLGAWRTAARHLHAVLRHGRRDERVRRSARIRMAADALWMLDDIRHMTSGTVAVLPRSTRLEPLDLTHYDLADARDRLELARLVLFGRHLTGKALQAQHG